METQQLTHFVSVPKLLSDEQVLPFDPPPTIPGVTEIGGRVARIDGFLAKIDGIGKFPEKKDSV